LVDEYFEGLPQKDLIKKEFANFLEVSKDLPKSKRPNEIQRMDKAEKEIFFQELRKS